MSFAGQDLNHEDRRLLLFLATGFLASKHPKKFRDMIQATANGNYLVKVLDRETFTDRMAAGGSTASVMTLYSGHKAKAIKLRDP
jgi:hypothetical protein